MPTCTFHKQDASWVLETKGDIQVSKFDRFHSYAAYRYDCKYASI